MSPLFETHLSLSMVTSLRLVSFTATRAGVTQASHPPPPPPPPGPGGGGGGGGVGGLCNSGSSGCKGD